jgi:hypothetical protein
MISPADFCEHESELKKIMDSTAKKLGAESFFNSAKQLINQCKAFLFHDSDGYLILRPVASGKKMGVLVYFAFSRSHVAVKSHHDSIEKMCREVDAEFICFYSLRRGFEKIAPSLGYRAIREDELGVHWRKELWAATTLA